MAFRTSLKTITSALLLLALLPVGAFAAIAPLSPEQKQAMSSHIVTGKVIAITSKVEKSKVEKAFGVHRDRAFQITILVEAVAKGANISKGDQIQVYAWKPSLRLPAMPGLQGHEGIPKEGDSVKLFLKKREKLNAFEPLLPNGIEQVN